MPHKSTLPPITGIPETNILSFLFPDPASASTTPIWIDADNPQISLSPAQLLSWVKRLAVGLERSTQPGDVIMVFSPNHVFVPVTFLAILGSGRIFSAGNPAFGGKELAYQLDNTSASTLLIHPSLLAVGLEAATKVNLPRDRIYLLSDDTSSTGQAAVDGIRSMHSILGSQSESSIWKWPSLDGGKSKKTVAMLNYSSGTTGMPKGVVVSHYNLIANTLQLINVLYSRPLPYEPRWIGFLPMYHCFGQLFHVLMAAKLCIPVYIMQVFHYENFLRVIQDFRITTLHCAPPIMVMLDKRPETERYDLSSLKEIMCGAAPMTRQLQNAVSKKLGVIVGQGWGMTEVTAGAMHTPGGVTDDTGSVGILDANCETKLLGENGNEVAEGEPGELYFRGPQNSLGYWKNDLATRELINSEGWLRTGDVAVIKNDWYWIVDRKKELIKVNGLQVPPAELEATLLENEDIADAAVVGITVSSTGEEYPRAYVSLKEHAKGKVTERDVQEWIRARVAKHKYLVGGVVFVDEVPKSPSGKILRKVMREWAKRDAVIVEREDIVRSRL